VKLLVLACLLAAAPAFAESKRDGAAPSKVAAPAEPPQYLASKDAPAIPANSKERPARHLALKK
jgi:hypothetical protein